MDPGANNFRYIGDLKNAFYQWKKTYQSKQAAPETEVNKIHQKFQELKVAQLKRLQEMKEKEKDDIQSLKNRLRRLQSNEPDSSSIEETDVWTEFKRSRGVVVSEINQRKENGGNGRVSLCEEDCKLLRYILETSYTFVETKLNDQSSYIKKILHVQTRQDDMQKTTDDKVLNEEIKHLQKALSYRTAQDILESFIKDEWKTSICEKCTKCQYLETEFEKNLLGLKKYTKACLKLSFSMCTDIPKRQFDQDISIDHFTKPNSVQLNTTELSNTRLRLLWPAVVYKDENDRLILEEKGYVQIVSEHSTKKDLDKQDVSGDFAQCDTDTNPSPTVDGNSNHDTHIQPEDDANDSGGTDVGGHTADTAGVNRNDDQVQGETERRSRNNATSANSRKHNKNEKPKIHTAGQNTNNPYDVNPKKTGTKTTKL